MWLSEERTPHASHSKHLSRKVLSHFGNPNYRCRVSFLTRLLLLLCVFAGIGTGMVHSYSHGEKDECASHCESGSHGKELPSDHDEQDSAPHHHHCCHVKSADRVLDSMAMKVAFQEILLELSTDHSLAPDEPVFSLDKPPLI